MAPYRPGATLRGAVASRRVGSDAEDGGGVGRRGRTLTRARRQAGPSRDGRRQGGIESTRAHGDPDHRHPRGCGRRLRRHERVLVRGSGRVMMVPVQRQLDDLRPVVGRSGMDMIVAGRVRSDGEEQGPGACDTQERQQRLNRSRHGAHSHSVSRHLHRAGPTRSRQTYNGMRFGATPATCHVELANGNGYAPNDAPRPQPTPLRPRRTATSE